jgi:hypothetical protein
LKPVFRLRAVGFLPLFAVIVSFGAANANAGPSAAACLGGGYQDLLKASGQHFSSVQDCENYIFRGGKFSPIHVGDFALNFFVQNKMGVALNGKIEPSSEEFTCADNPTSGSYSVAVDQNIQLTTTIDQSVWDGCKFRQSRGRWFVLTPTIGDLGYLDVNFLEPEPGRAGWGTSCTPICCTHSSTGFRGCDNNTERLCPEKYTCTISPDTVHLSISSVK